MLPIAHPRRPHPLGRMVRLAGCDTLLGFSRRRAAVSRPDAQVPPPGPRPPRAPTLLDAVLPILVLIGLLALTIVLFGIDATNGPLQVALFLSAAFASLIAFK